MKLNPDKSLKEVLQMAKKTYTKVASSVSGKKHGHKSKSKKHPTRKHKKSVHKKHRGGNKKTRRHRGGSCGKNMEM